MKTKIFQIKKYFRGGYTTFYAYMSPTRKMKRGCWTYQLSDWGENTSGGHSYGYTINVKRVNKRPSKARLMLRFNKEYLEKII